MAGVGRVSREGVVSSNWIRVYSPADSAPVRLVCLAHAGGAATAFLGLARSMSPNIELLAVQYPGRQDRHHDPFILDIRRLAAGVYSALSAFPDLPIAIFGHSMGALVGYELALCFERATDSRLLGFLPSGLPAPSKGPIAAQPATDEQLLEHVAGLGGTDSAVIDDPDVLDLVLPALRADSQAVALYRHQPTPALRCPTLACVGNEDPLTTIADAEAWRDLVDGPFTLRRFEGGHFYLQTATTALTATLIAVLRDWASSRYSRG